MSKIDAERICLIRTSAIGDTVHALALANGLKHEYPDAHLTWVLQTLPYEMVKHQPSVDKFITFNRKAGAKEWRELISILQKERFDLAIIPQASAKTSFIAFFTPARIKLGFDRSRSRELHGLVTNRKIPYRPMGHVQDQFFEFLEYLGATEYPIRWDFRFTEEERQWRQGFFASFDRPAIGFVIASAHREKDWRADYYARIMDHVDFELGFQPLMIGGPSEREKQIADEISSQCRCTPFAALEKPIRHTMLQLEGCRMVVAPDTGPLHIAVALGAPTVGLYGYSNPRRCGPYRFRDLLIDHYNDPGEEDAPITRKTRPGRMETIQPREVIEKIEYGLAAYQAKTCINKPE
ncbi:MAG: glycosyltransferase family 9 protein [Candidatus Hydrogenedentota bacterium]